MLAASRDPFSESNPMVRYLESVGNEGDLARVLSEAMEDGYGLLSLTELAYCLGCEHGLLGNGVRDYRPQAPPYSEDETERVLHRVNRVIISSSEGDADIELAREPFTLRIARNWSEIGSENTARQWVRRQARRDEFLLGLIDQASFKIRSTGCLIV
jgi:hypothetical protein